ncbi:MAG: ABC transporter permease [Eubacteriales bacterium]|nr:ABC transporter permease [Eubacteriales bacterium]
MSNPTGGSDRARPVSLKTAGKRLFSDYSYMVSFILIVGIAIAVNPNFFKWRNITNIFVQSSVIGLIALGMTMVICAGQIDISVGAQVAIISGFGIEVLNATHSVLLMLVFCMAFGTVIGTINGLLIAKGKMPAMVATLAIQTSCRAIINHFGQGGPFTVAGGISTEPYYEAYRAVANDSLNIFGAKFPYPMLIFIAVSLLFGLIMQRTKLGKHIYAVGSNAVSARLSGVNVSRTMIAVFSITGLMCGFASWIYASRLMAVAASSAGNLFEMDAIAAVAIGGTAMSGGRGKIIGTFMGVIMFKIINNILVAAQVPTFLNGAISGAIIILAVLLQNVRGDKK